MLGVADFYILLGCCLKSLNTIVRMFYLPPNIPDTLVEICCVLSKLDYLACNTITVKKITYGMPNGLIYKICNTSPPMFQCWGEEESMLQKQFKTFFLTTEKLTKD